MQRLYSEFVCKRQFSRKSFSEAKVLFLILASFYTEKKCLHAKKMTNGIYFASGTSQFEQNARKYFEKLKTFLFIFFCRRVCVKMNKLFRELFWAAVDWKQVCLSTVYLCECLKLLTVKIWT